MFTLSIAEVAIIVAIVLTMGFIGFYLINLVNKLRKELNKRTEAYEFIRKKLIEANNDKATYVNVIDYLLSERDSN